MGAGSLRQWRKLIYFDVLGIAQINCSIWRDRKRALRSARINDPEYCAIAHIADEQRHSTNGLIDHIGHHTATCDHSCTAHVYPGPQKRPIRRDSNKSADSGVRIRYSRNNHITDIANKAQVRTGCCRVTVSRKNRCPVTVLIVADQLMPGRSEQARRTANHNKGFGYGFITELRTTVSINSQQMREAGGRHNDGVQISVKALNRPSQE